MLEEYVLFSDKKRYVINRQIIDDVAIPLGDVYDDELFKGYFADYAGMVRTYKPKRFLEIGVRYGYTGIVVATAIKSLETVKSPLLPFEYRGMDDESYHNGSCARANENFKKAIPWCNSEAIKWNSFGDWPDLGTFDMIHVDGNHDYNGVWNDLNKAWPILNAGGFILLDDATTPGIAAAIDNFLYGFEKSEEVVRFHRQANERYHVYIQKVA